MSTLIQIKVYRIYILNNLQIFAKYDK